MYLLRLLLLLLLFVPLYIYMTTTIQSRADNERESSVHIAHTREISERRHVNQRLWGHAEFSGQSRCMRRWVNDRIKTVVKPCIHTALVVVVACNFAVYSYIHVPPGCLPNGLERPPATIISCGARVFAIQNVWNNSVFFFFNYF